MIGYSGRVREPLAYVAKVQSQWEKRVLKSLNSMCMELGQSLAKPRCQNEQQELLSKFLQNHRTTELQIYRSTLTRRSHKHLHISAHWNDLSNLDMDLSLFRPVYSPKVRF